MTTRLSRSQAKRNTLLAQAGAAVLLGGAVVVAAVGLPSSSSTEVAPVSIDQVMTERAAERQRVDSLKVVDEEREHPRVAMSSIATRLMVLHDVPKAAEPQTEPVEEIPTYVSNEPEKAEIKFLGFISEPTRRVALLSVNGQQRFVAQGSTASFTLEGSAPVKVSVVSIDGDELVLERQGVRETYHKSQRAGQVVTKIEGRAPTARAPENQAAAAARSQEEEIERRRQEAMERRQRMIDSNRREGERQNFDPDRMQNQRN